MISEFVMFLAMKCYDLCVKKVGQVYALKNASYIKQNNNNKKIIIIIIIIQLNPCTLALFVQKTLINMTKVLCATLVWSGIM